MKTRDMRMCILNATIQSANLQISPDHAGDNKGLEGADEEASLGTIQIKSETDAGHVVGW